MRWKSKRGMGQGALTRNIEAFMREKGGKCTADEITKKFNKCTVKAIKKAMNALIRAQKVTPGTDGKTFHLIRMMNDLAEIERVKEAQDRRVAEVSFQKQMDEEEKKRLEAKGMVRQDERENNEAEGGQDAEKS